LPSSGQAIVAIAAVVRERERGGVDGAGCMEGLDALLPSFHLQ
jgi:uncharacterized protein YoaH (UPF0181 family)